MCYLFLFWSDNSIIKIFVILVSVIIDNININLATTNLILHLSGGIQRSNGQMFMVECENNKRDHNTLIPAIIQHVYRGTLIVTDKWKGYLHLDKHGYRHEDVNHKREFVNPLMGAHTNGIEGSWLHAKRHVRRGQGRVRTNSDALGADLQECMWLKKLHITRTDADCRRLFSKELPLLFDRVFG